MSVYESFPNVMEPTPFHLAEPKFSLKPRDSAVKSLTWVF